MRKENMSVWPEEDAGSRIKPAYVGIKYTTKNIPKGDAYKMKHSFFRITALLLILTLFCMSMTGCMTNLHTVGRGAQTGKVETSRQWYALWGLIKLGDKDTKHMVGGAADYKIETYYGAVDMLINMVLGGFSIGSRTIKVTK